MAEKNEPQNDSIVALDVDSLEVKASDECDQYYYPLQDDIRCYQRSILHSVLMENKFIDVTFVVGPNKVKFGVIRALMASISPVFEAMLFGVMQESVLNSEIIIEDIEQNGFRSVINFAYLQNPGITTSNLSSVYQICDKYQITKLSALCETLFHQIIKPNNLCLLLSDAIYFKCDKLINLCKENLSKFGVVPKYLFQSNGFLKMSVNAMILFLQCDDLNIVEDDLWEYVLKWIKYQNIKHGIDDDAKSEETDDSSNDLLKQILPFIRFGAMSSKYFIENVKPLNLLTDKEVIQILTDQITENYLKPRNVYPNGYLPLKCFVFLHEFPQDSDYDENNEEEKEQYQRDQEEDQYYSMEQDDQTELT